MENTSGHGQFATIPPGLKRWNWGAFFFTWIWGIGNGTYIALLALIPILNFIMPIYLGLVGHELAWRNRYFEDVEACNKVQKRWGLAGLAFTILYCLLVLVWIA